MNTEPKYSSVEIPDLAVATAMARRAQAHAVRDAFLALGRWLSRVDLQGRTAGPAADLQTACRSCGA